MFLFLINLFEIITDFFEQMYPGLNKNFYEKNDNLDLD